MKARVHLLTAVMMLTFYSALRGGDIVQFQVVTNSTGSWYGTVSAAIGDFDLDGRMDVATVVKSNLFIFKNQGDGALVLRASYTLETFRSATVAVADFDNDARPDLIVAMDGVLQLWHGRGDGTFVLVSRHDVNAAPNEIVIGDFNNDRHQDVLLITSSAAEYREVLTLVLGGPDSGFRPPLFYPLAYPPVGRVAVGDFNRDGFLDVAIGHSRASTPTGVVALVSVLLGTGDGSFTNGTAVYVDPLDLSDVRTGDLNGDGIPDLLTAHFNMGYVSCLLGNGDGTFQPPIRSRAGSHPSSLAIGDFNGDGYPDVIAADNVLSEIWVLQGDGSGQFRSFGPPLESRYPYVVATADFDNDRRLDFLGLISGTIENGVVKTYLNRTQPSLQIRGGAQQVPILFSRVVPAYPRTPLGLCSTAPSPNRTASKRRPCRQSAAASFFD